MNLTESVTFQSVADNLRESFRVIAASRGAGQVRELPGVSIAAAGVTFQIYNAVFLSAPVATEADLAQQILLPSLHFNARGLEWAYWVCEDWMESRLQRRSRQIFERHGLRHFVDFPGMVAERIRPPVRPLPRMIVRRVCDQATRGAFCAIGAVCFRVPIAWFCEIFDSGTVWERFAAYVGYVNQEPVSTAAIVIGGGALGVYDVATMPGHQHRGYGEAVMRQALADTQQHYDTERVILQSTPEGYRLYERMGFRTVTKVAVYTT
jgi:ribosomal protein S18 acetylase RimI-like enzyme